VRHIQLLSFDIIRNKSSAVIRTPTRFKAVITPGHQRREIEPRNFMPLTFGWDVPIVCAIAVGPPSASTISSMDFGFVFRLMLKDMHRTAMASITFGNFLVDKARCAA
jgi:hypothetical protein